MEKPKAIVLGELRELREGDRGKNNEKKLLRRPGCYLKSLGKKTSDRCQSVTRGVETLSREIITERLKLTGRTAIIEEEIEKLRGRRKRKESETPTQKSSLKKKD